MRIARKMAPVGVLIAVQLSVMQIAFAGPAGETAALKAKGDAAFDARRFAEALQS